MRTFTIPYRPIDVVLLGTHTLDVIWEEGVVITTSGALANIQRNLTVDNYSYLPLQFAECSIKGDEKNLIYWGGESNAALSILPKNGWCHICYLDWLNLTAKELATISSRSHMLTIDLARIDTAKQETRDLLGSFGFDLVFCSDEQDAWVDAKNKFVHALDWWDVKIGNSVYTYKTTPVALEFSLGAGDTLVACVLNNCKTVQEIPAKFKEIEVELNQRLLDREKWFKGQKLIS